MKEIKNKDTVNNKSLADGESNVIDTKIELDRDTFDGEIIDSSDELVSNNTANISEEVVTNEECNCTNDKKNIEYGSNEHIKIEFWMRIGIIVVIILACVAVYLKAVKNADNRVEHFNSSYELSSTDKKDVLDKIDSKLTEMKSENTYFRVNSNDGSYTTVLRNTKGQSVAQDSSFDNIAIYLGEGNVVIRYNDYIERTYDMDVVSLADKAIRIAKEDGNNVYVLEAKDKVSSDNGDYTLNYIDLEGFEQIKELYSQLGDDVANSIVGDIKSAVQEINNDELDTENATEVDQDSKTLEQDSKTIGKDKEEVKLDENVTDTKEIKDSDVTIRFTFVTDDTDAFSVGCSLIYNNEEYSNWYFDGYLDVYEWELDQDWFSSDFTNVDVAESVLANLMDELDKMMLDYANDHNLESDDSTESKQSSSDITNSSDVVTDSKIKE